MRGRRMLYVDQYGTIFYASTVTSLCRQFGGGSARRMFLDVKGTPRHVGYIIDQHWFRAFVPYMGEP